MGTKEASSTSEDLSVPQDVEEEFQGVLVSYISEYIKALTLGAQKDS